MQTTVKQCDKKRVFPGEKSSITVSMQFHCELKKFSVTARELESWYMGLQKEVRKTRRNKRESERNS